MHSYIKVIRHEGSHSKIVFNNHDTIVLNTAPRVALKNWLNERGTKVRVSAVYEQRTKEDGPKEIICWIEDL